MNRKWIVYLVSFAAFLGPFTQTVYTPILPEVITEFQTSLFLVNLSISIFTLVLALMQMVYGPLTDAKGRRRVMLFGISLYVIASVGCFFSHSIYGLLFFRAFQAVGIAAGSVVAVTVIGDLYEGKSRGKAMGTFQMMVTLGPVVGPVVGGFLGGTFDFHSVFAVLAGVGLLAGVCHFLFLPETKPHTQQIRRFSVHDFVAILRDPLGSSVVMLGFVQYYAYYNFLVFLPGVLGERYGLTAQQKGLVFLPMTLFIVAGSFVGGRIQERFEGKKVLVSTSYANVLAIVLFLLVAHASLPLLVVSTMAFGLCLGMSLPIQTTLLTHAFQSNRATAVGVYNFFRYMGMACGPVLGSALLNMGGYAMLYGFAAAAFFGSAFVLHKRFLLRTNA